MTWQNNYFYVVCERHDATLKNIAHIYMNLYFENREGTLGDNFLKVAYGCKNNAN